jgi:hypothetical protein
MTSERTHEPLSQLLADLDDEGRTLVTVLHGPVTGTPSVTPIGHSRGRQRGVR